MKKFAVLLVVLFVVAFGSVAFAATGGHVVVDPTPVQNPTIGTVTATGATLNGAPSISTVANLLLVFNAGNIDLTSIPNATGIAVQTIISADVTATAGSTSVTLSIPLTSFTWSPAAGKGLYVMVKKTGAGGIYNVFPATFTATTPTPPSGVLRVTISPIADYFTNNQLVVAGVTTPVTPTPNPSSPGGSSGCSAGLGALALLCVVPLILRRRT